MLAPSRGRGLGAKLLAEAERYAREKGADHLWLDAMKAAPWAWQTYHRWGFREIGQT
jgi:GNAT superfamily N-acetyltransferase